MWEVCPPPPCEVDRDEAAAAAAPAEDGEGRREAMLAGRPGGRGAFRPTRH